MTNPVTIAIPFEVPVHEPNQRIQEELDKVVLAQDELDEIKKNLSQILEAIAHNPSLISRAARFWGGVDLPDKIITGVVLIVPTLAIGVAAHLAVLVAISLLTLFVFTASSFLLDNHHSQSSTHFNCLQSVVLGLANALGQIILSLDTLRQQLKIQIQQLAVHVGELNNQVQELTQQADRLAASIQEHAELLQRTEKNSEQIQINLSMKINELDRIKLEMSSEMLKGKNITEALKGSILTLSELISMDDDHKKAFEEKLNLFLENREASFHLVAARIGKAEEQLEIVTKELNLSNKRYTELLDRGDAQITRLERWQTTPPSQERPELPAKILNTHGFYATANTLAVNQPLASPEITFISC